MLQKMNYYIVYLLPLQNKILKGLNYGGKNMQTVLLTQRPIDTYAVKSRKTTLLQSSATLGLANLQ